MAVVEPSEDTTPPAGAGVAWRAALVRSGIAWPLEGALAALEAHGGAPGIPPRTVIDDALSPLAGVRFVPPRLRARRGKKKSPPAYDASIVLSAEVQTREGNLHDLMNALVWATFPRAKRSLHALQHRLVQACFDAEGNRAVPHRSAEADAIAMVDEGGVVILCVPGEAERLVRLLRDRHEAPSAIERTGAAAIVFGHALYEHLARSDDRIAWGKAVVFATPTPFDRSPARIREVDTALARLLDEGPIEDCGSAPLVPSVWQRSTPLLADSHAPRDSDPSVHPPRCLLRP